jgi:hypothetical protein
MFGLSSLKLGLMAGAALAVLAGIVAVRHHDRQVGWDHALEAVKKQDGRAVDAAHAAQKTADDCYAANGSWSVVTGACTP